MSALSPTLRSVVDSLSSKRFRYADEAMLHRGIMMALDFDGVAYQHEVAVVGGRIDFVIDRLGVEVKIKGSNEALRRQLERYAHNPDLDEFLVVTTRPAHSGVADQIGGKPVWVLVIGALTL